MLVHPPAIRRREAWTIIISLSQPAPLFETASVESPAGHHKSAVTSSRPFSLSVWNPFENNAHHIFSSTTFDPIIEVVTTSMHNTI
ncbi:hypothetical protein VDGE_30179 [Verticillium dahliae]|uniref:Uncharacterized protein n=1 Tax=Verticillium dahliae TaxID=27337 RepID=A0A444RPT4_VERDA|nr:hypothetical protein VDGE_30179 [Verticillium dahliae]